MNPHRNHLGIFSFPFLFLSIFIVSGIGIFWPFASAQAESNKTASFSLMFGPFRPDQAGARQAGITWQDVYGGGNSLFSGAEWEREIIQKYGILAFGGGAGWIQASGKSLKSLSPPTSSGESTSFQIAEARRKGLRRGNVVISATALFVGLLVKAYERSAYGHLRA